MKIEDVSNEKELNQDKNENDFKSISFHQNRKRN